MMSANKKTNVAVVHITVRLIFIIKPHTSEMLRHAPRAHQINRTHKIQMNRSLITNLRNLGRVVAVLHLNIIICVVVACTIKFIIFRMKRRRRQS